MYDVYRNYQKLGYYCKYRKHGNYRKYKRSDLPVVIATGSVNYRYHKNPVFFRYTENTTRLPETQCFVKSSLVLCRIRIDDINTVSTKSFVQCTLRKFFL